MNVILPIGSATFPVPTLGDLRRELKELSLPGETLVRSATASTLKRVMDAYASQPDSTVLNRRMVIERDMREVSIRFLPGKRVG